MIHLSFHSRLSLISVSGREAQNFLNNISTREVGADSVENVWLNSLCNNKGRIVCLFYLLGRSPGYWLVVPADLREKITGLLNLYRLRAQVSIDPADDWCLGTLAPAPGAVASFERPEAFPLGVRLRDGAGHPGIRTAQLGRRIARSLLICQEEYAGKAGDWFDDCTLVADDRAWRHAGIVDAQPWLDAAHSEKYLAQSLDLDRAPLAVCSLDKGCYPGQEIIARMHYLGKRKRGLFWCSAEESLAAGQKLYKNTKTVSEAGAETGTVLDGVRLAGGTGASIALAELALNDTGSPLSLYDGQGHPVEARPCYPREA